MTIKNPIHGFCTKMSIMAVAIGLSAQTMHAQETPAGKPAHTFSIGEKDFMLDGKPIELRVGELHFARVPREYWRHRLQLMKAMGMNAVCAYLFWNYHEFEQGKFVWEGQADAAEFCRIAQEEGMWVVLRPGPYVCAEWDGGGLPWWLLKNDKIQMRSSDPVFLKASQDWFKEVGRVLGPLQVTKGGPILLAQVENEYGFYNNDANYMGTLRQYLIDSGFDIPLFACNPSWSLRNGYRKDLFNVVNFGSDAKGAMKKLREVQPTGPLMSGEFYPGWFDTWGAPHHLGNTKQYLADLEYMVANNVSFSLYMAHGGTSFGMWPGADRPFKPDTNSYDYDAPISEAGWIGEKFKLTRDLMASHPLPGGEKLPDPPAPIPVMSISEFKLTKVAPVFDNLPEAIKDSQPRNMEAYDQGHGCTVYRTELPAGPATTLKVPQAHDFAWVFLDGKQVGVMDRRSRKFSVKLPAREKAARLDILVEAMGHVNFGKEIHDRKGLMGPVTIGSKTETTELKSEWQVYPLNLDDKQLAGLKWDDAPQGQAKQPAFWSGTFEVSKPADTFLDLTNWGKGVIWVNGHCLSRFWNIGPTQTCYMPGAWLKEGKNEVVILDLLGPEKPTLAGLEKPILDRLRPALDFAPVTMDGKKLMLDGVQPVLASEFPAGSTQQDVKFDKPVKAKQFCIETLSAQDGKPFAAIAELDLLDADGKSISHNNWKIAYADSQEQAAEDGSASNAIDGQTANYWHTAWKDKQPKHPHRLILDLGDKTTVAGFRYTPRSGADTVTGRIKEYRIYMGDALVVETEE